MERSRPIRSDKILTADGRLVVIGVQPEVQDPAYFQCNRGGPAFTLDTGSRRGTKTTHWCTEPPQNAFVFQPDRLLAGLVGENWRHDCTLLCQTFPELNILFKQELPCH
jgi:hypothetical protein